jgi:hypothetical protein
MVRASAIDAGCLTRDLAITTDARFKNRLIVGGGSSPDDAMSGGHRLYRLKEK